MLIGKKSNLEPGYIYAPYIPVTTNSVIVEYGSKNTIRKKKINKIFNLGLDIKDEFSPSKSITSRYSQVHVSNPYQTITINNMI
jgi:hypothetical protein